MARNAIRTRANGEPNWAAELPVGEAEGVVLVTLPVLEALVLEALVVVVLLLKGVLLEEVEPVVVTDTVEVVLPVVVEPADEEDDVPPLMVN